jgi:hypothetical protein
MFQQYGTPRECAALLFRRVTGRELPETTRILIVQENSWPDRGSTGSNHLGALGVSAVREQEYLDTVMTIVHELGHQVCPIGEAAIYEGIMPVHLRAREEAAAYCFEYACMMQFDDPALRDIMTVYFTEERDQQIEKLCAGKITEHSLGMTIADAALSLYPLDLAWKKIGTGSELDPQILSRVDEIRNLRHRLHQLASPPAPQ